MTISKIDDVITQNFTPTWYNVITYLNWKKIKLSNDILHDTVYILV